MPLCAVLRSGEKVKRVNAIGLFFSVLLFFWTLQTVMWRFDARSIVWPCNDKRNDRDEEKPIHTTFQIWVFDFFSVFLFSIFIHNPSTRGIPTLSILSYSTIISDSFTLPDLLRLIQDRLVVG